MDINRNLLNHRENLQAEPQRPDELKKKSTLQQLQQQSMQQMQSQQPSNGTTTVEKMTTQSTVKTFRVSKIKSIASPKKKRSEVGSNKDILAALLQSPQNGIMGGQGVLSPPQPSGKGFTLAKGAIVLPAKGRRVVRLQKRSQIQKSDTMTSSNDVNAANTAAGVSKSFNPYENNRSSANATDSAVALPQQWQQQLPLTIHQQKSAVKRPSTPEEHRKQCLDCGNMKDFIFGLQREVKRLQDLANEFNLQIILSGGTPEEELQIEQQPKPVVQKKADKKLLESGADKNTGGEEATFKKICPDCPTTQKRMQAQRQRQVQEQQTFTRGVEASTEPTTGSAVAGSSSFVSSNLLRMNTNSLFPRNNLIDGGNLGENQGSTKQQLDMEEQKSGGVRISHLKEMRRQAFAQQELDFVGKLTSQQQAVRLPNQNAEQIRDMNTVVSSVNGQNIRVQTPNRVGSSNLAFRKKKASSIMQQLPPLAGKQQVVNFQPQPYHITKEDSEDNNAQNN